MENNGIPSKQFNVWSRLYTRFRLEPHPLVESRAAVAMDVQPITDADQLLRRPNVERTVFTVTGTGVQLVRTVPAGERWTVNLIRVTLLDGTWTHSNVQLNDPNGDQMILNAWSSSSGSILTDLNKDVIADEGWEFYVNISAYTAQGFLHFDLLKLVEDAF